MCKMIVKFLKSKVFHHWQKFQHKSIKKVYMYGNQTQKQNTAVVVASFPACKQTNKEQITKQTKLCMYRPS